MKQIMVVLLCFPLFSLAQQTCILDDNFEQALIDLGREEPIKKNSPLLYIYEDGSTQKRGVID
jgi:hypothetical protein